MGISRRFFFRVTTDRVHASDEVGQALFSGERRGSSGPPAALISVCFAVGLVACSTTPSAPVKINKPVTAKAKRWLASVKAQCQAPRCKHGTAILEGTSEQEACAQAKKEALSELAKSVKVRVQSVFTDKLEEMNGTVFQEVRSKIVVSTDVELEGAPPPECLFDGGQAYAFATMDFGPKIDFLRRELDRRQTNIYKSLKEGKEPAFDQAFAGYARAFVEAINADDQRVWLVGLDPAAAGVYAQIPTRAVEAMDGLMQRARSLKLASQGEYSWAGSGARLQVRLQTGAPSGARSIREPVVEWTGPLVRSLGHESALVPTPNTEGVIQLPLKPLEGAASQGETKATAKLNWTKTLASVRSKVLGKRAKEILDWMMAGLPPVQAELTVYGPGHPSALVDGLREFLCDGEDKPLELSLSLQDAKGAVLSQKFRRRLQARLDWGLGLVNCRKVRFSVTGRKRADVTVKVWAPGQAENAQVSFYDKRRNRRSVSRIDDAQDVCVLRCEFEQWEAAQKTCGGLAEARLEAGVCLMQSLYFSGAHEKGLSQAQRLYRLDRTNSEYAAWFGVFLTQTGRFEEGLKIMESISDRKEVFGFADYWMALAAARCRASDTEGAKAAFRAYLKIPGAPKKQEVKATIRKLRCGGV